MNKTIAVILLIPISYVAYWMIYLQAPVPPLDELQNIVIQVESLQEKFRRGKPGYHYIEMTAVGVNGILEINRTDYLDDDSENYSKVRNNLFVNDEIIVWLRPEPDWIFDFDNESREEIKIVEKPSSSSVSGLANFSKTKVTNPAQPLPIFEILHVTKGNQKLVDRQVSHLSFENRQKGLQWAGVIILLIWLFVLGKIALWVSTRIYQKASKKELE